MKSPGVSENHTAMKEIYHWIHFPLKKILINAPIEGVFGALTTSDAILNYFPLTAVESDWVVGGEVLYRGEINGLY